MATTNNIPVIAYLTPEQKKTLDQLARVTRVPKSVYLREAVDDLLVKHAKALKKGGAK